MRRVFLIAVLTGSVLRAAPAAAQTPATPATRPPATTTNSGNDTPWMIGGVVGAESVENVGGLFGGEVGVRLSDRVEVFGEAVWMQDVVTRLRLEAANSIAAFLQSTQGKTATGTVTAPSFYGGAGVRLMLMTTGQVRPYVMFGAGAAHIAFQPTFTLAGSDITSSLPQYGVTLGSDLTGEVTEPAFTGGFGVRFAQMRWYIDGGIRVISIRTSDQATNVLGASASVGFKF